jgi:osmotically-inducible protein OsmY
MKNDQQLQQDVMDELKWDPSLSPSEIGVSVKNGVVTLSGHVNSYTKKQAAERATKRVKGVRAVAEDLTVKLDHDGMRDDTDIAQAALNALLWDSSVPDEKIKIKVENGWVTMEGLLDWQYQKEAAYRAVRNLKGVKGVINLVSIKPRIDVSVVEKRIREALKRSAEVEADNIDVAAAGNKVVIKGRVRSWSEKREVERAAWSAPGLWR